MNECVQSQRQAKSQDEQKSVINVQLVQQINTQSIIHSHTHTQNKTVELPTLLGGPCAELSLIRGTLRGLLLEYPEAPVSTGAWEVLPLKVMRSLRRRLMRICWSTSWSVWKHSHTNENSVIKYKDTFKGYLLTTYNAECVKCCSVLS